MKTYLLTSAFDPGFTPDFSRIVKERLKKTETFVFIASSFDTPQKNQRYAEAILKMFSQIDMDFKQRIIIDERMPKDNVREVIEKADVIWLSGGDTLKQISYLKAYQLDQILPEYDGMVIGMSAGSINMASKVVLAKDVEDNIPKLSIYEGLGLVNLNIEPHLDLSRKDHVDEIKRASQEAPIYGLYDNSFICVEQGKVQIYGPYVLFDKEAA